jgi:pyroglutamyl-peptidase
MTSVKTASTSLVTSFAPWRPHQRSNASDDLLSEVLKVKQFSAIHVLRQLPVNVPVAKALILDKVQQLQPQVVICCGMAESRHQLHLESRAVVGDRIIYTSLSLEKLVKNLRKTEISQDAGRFVCNGLYYAILNHLQSHHPAVQCLFVHVPILTPTNKAEIVADFLVILERVLTIE